MTNYNDMHRKHLEREAIRKAGSSAPLSGSFRYMERDLFIDAQMVYDGLQELPVAEPTRTIKP